MIEEPVWITEQMVRSLNKDLTQDHGGVLGIRDEGLLAAALARPVNFYCYTEPKADLAALAASYAFAMARNHPFLDGNKRSACMSAFLFLELNHCWVSYEVQEGCEVFVKLASGGMTEEDMADWLRERTYKSEHPGLTKN